MTEAAGLTLGVANLARLFSTCIDAFDSVQLALPHGRDLRDLQLLHTKLDNQKVRFMIWGHSLGLDEPTRRLEVDIRPQETRGAVIETMQLIISLFEESGGLVARYGLAKADFQTSAAVALTTGNEASAWKMTFRRFNDRISRFRPRQPSTTRWVIVDRTKFLDLVRDLGELIDGLDLLNRSDHATSNQKTMIEYEVEGIDDEHSLSLVKDADSGLISQVAGLRLSSFSIPSGTPARPPAQPLAQPVDEVASSGIYSFNATPALPPEKEDPGDDFDDSKAAQETSQDLKKQPLVTPPRAGVRFSK
jgi:hypothetical protein